MASRPRRGLEKATPLPAAGPNVLLNGNTLQLLKTGEEFVLVAAGPGPAGTTVLGGFVPAFAGAEKLAGRILDAMAVASRERGGDAAGAAILTEASLGLPGGPSPAVPGPVPAADCAGRDPRTWQELREGYLRDHRCLTAPELAELTGSRSRNPSSRAREWLRAGKIFAVYDGTSARFPLFQIDLEAGRPRREIRDALGHLREKLSDWQIAFWFVTANTWTGDWRRPLDLLGREPERVVEAARNEVAPEFL